MGEVPDAGAPVLQVDVAELRAGADEEFDGAAVEAGSRIIGCSAADGFGQQRRFSPFFQDNQACGRNRQRR